MILVDSSVWIDHFRKTDATLSALLASRVVLCHPFVIGELALGQLSKRDAVLAALGVLPMAPLVPHDDVLAFVERHQLAGSGIGWIDVHLLASTLVGGRVSLWSRDRRLATAAAARGVAYAATAN
ncbi:MAG: ribonuclease [Methylibium sp. NZG]|nr:MAG: ribonuclease [Methylibium sp. NZG]